jgi:hypothetical protein
VCLSGKRFYATLNLGTTDFGFCYQIIKFGFSHRKVLAVSVGYFSENFNCSFPGIILPVLYTERVTATILRDGETEEF